MASVGIGFWKWAELPWCFLQVGGGSIKLNSDRPRGCSIGLIIPGYPTARLSRQDATRARDNVIEPPDFKIIRELPLDASRTRLVPRTHKSRFNGTWRPSGPKNSKDSGIGRSALALARTFERGCSIWSGAAMCPAFGFTTGRGFSLFCAVRVADYPKPPAKRCYCNKGLTPPIPGVHSRENSFVMLLGTAGFRQKLAVTGCAVRSRVNCDKPFETSRSGILSLHKIPVEAIRSGIRKRIPFKQFFPIRFRLKQFFPAA